MPKMKAGPELDTRLCELLEPRPKIFGGTKEFSLVPAFSQLRFWIWKSGDDRWRPLPVSTDGTAMLKVVSALRRLHYEIRIVWQDRAYSLCEVALRDMQPPYLWFCGKGIELPEGLALAACEALEKRAEADGDDR